MKVLRKGVRALQRFLFERLGIFVRRHDRLPTGFAIDIDLKREYPNRNVSTIFDVGANIGQSVQRFRKDFPRSQIYSFEPIFRTYQQLAERSRNDQRVLTMNVALGDHDGEIVIPLNENPCWNTLSPTAQNLFEPVGYENVTVRSIDSILSELKLNNVDLLKLVAEGHELEILTGAKNSIEQGRISTILSEVGLQLADKQHTPFAAMNDYLQRKNYELFAIYNQCIGRSRKSMVFGDALWIRNHNVDREPLNRHFSSPTERGKPGQENKKS